LDKNNTAVIAILVAFLGLLLGGASLVNQFSGDYNELENIPDFSGFGSYDNLTGVPDLSGYGSYSNLTGVPDLSGFGSYSNLTGKPDIYQAIYEDDYTFWSVTGGGSCVISNEVAEIVKRGVASLKIVASGSNTVRHNYVGSGEQDFSMYDDFSFWWYGSDSDVSIILMIYSPTAGNRFEFVFTDNFVGGYHYVVSLSSFDVHGSANWATVDLFDFVFDGSFTCYFDRIAFSYAI